MVTNGPFSSLVKELYHNGTTYYYYDPCDLNQELYTTLPYSVRVLLEAAIRCCDDFEVKQEDVFKILNWEKTQFDNIEIPFKASRVILQDLTGVPALVDFAAMRDAISKLGGSPDKINPLCPTDLVIDHSVQVDYSRALLKDNKRIALNYKSALLCNDCQKIGKCSLESRFLNQSSQNDLANGFSKISLKNKIESWQPHSFDKLRQKSCPFHRLQSLGAESLEKNQQMEFTRNKERFYFLKWGAKAFKNMTIIPPGSGICHQVNLEYLARVVFIRDDNFLYPDSLVGADSHTTMINGLGIVGWGVGGIEAEAVMLGQAISMIIPQVVGYKLVGKLSSLATSTDLVLTITKHLRQVGVVGKFVEFFGPGVSELSIADRATIANMCPEYGATIAFFPVDEKALVYLNQTGRDENLIQVIQMYLEAVKLFRNYDDPTELKFSEVYELDLATVTTSTSGPKRPHDRVPVTEMKYDFLNCLTNKIGFKGYGLSPDRVSDEVSFMFHGSEYVLRHGSVVISAITSCTNTSNPSVMLGAGLLAKKAVLKGLSVAPYIKTSMSPGSGVVTYYLRESGVIEYLEKLGFDVVGYGCMTCIGNSGSLSEAIVSAIEKKDLVVAGVLSGNRNFEGRVHPNTRANYLASPLLVVAYAIAGTIVIDFEKEPLGRDPNGQDVFLKDIWPSREEIQAVEEKYVIPAMFKEVYSKIECGNEQWNSLHVPEHRLFPWNPESTYIKSPPFFDKMTLELPKIESIKNAKVLVFFGDSVTTDHISPAGSIARSSKAAEYLMRRGIEPVDFNSYGSRRGNDEVMARATFANIRLVNKLASKTGPKTLHIPSNEEMFIFEAATKYKSAATPLIIIAGRDYGSGSSRDWAAKGPFLLGIKAVIVESYERIHRSNLIGMGLLPLQFLEGQSAATLGLNGKETYSIEVPPNLTPRQRIKVEVNDNGKTNTFEVIVRIDTAVELQYFKNGGILHYMLRRIMRESG